MFFYGEISAQDETSTAGSSASTATSSSDEATGGVKRDSSKTDERSDFDKASIEDKSRYLKEELLDSEQTNYDLLKNNPEVVKKYEEAQQMAIVMDDVYNLSQERLANLDGELEKLEAAKDRDEAKIKQKMEEIKQQKKVVKQAKEAAEKAQNEFDNTSLAKAKKELSIIKGKSVLWETVLDSSEFDISLLTVSEDSNEDKLRLMTDDPESEYNIFNRVINLMMGIIGTFAVLMLIVGGYFFIVSAGDENRLQKAKGIFINTIGGLIVAFLSVLIVQAVFAFLF